MEPRPKSPWGIPYPRGVCSPRGRETLAPSVVQPETDKRLLPATAVLAVVVVVAVALVVVPFLVPVTNSIWREEGRE